MRTSVVSRGHTISYRTEGTGTSLVLLAGWSQWADRWWEAGYIDRLRDQYQVIGIDRLGHGESDKPHDPLEYLEPLIVSDIVAVLDAEHVDQVLVWGHSAGARDAAALAELEPQRVAGLVCAAGVPMPRSQERSAQSVAMAERIKTDEGMTAFLEGMGSPAEAVTASMQRNDSAALAAAMAGPAEWSATPDKIRAPSLWYVGSDDNGGFTREAVDTASRLGVETHVMPGADHVAVFRRTDDVLAFVQPFLDRNNS
ncbi:MAG: pimeloyl-ACP methyl ester carboxylesterase [Acidimicrobiales bacterium]|jgi:pimeloyl-ACP methyl ester carboxylesterase